MVDDPSHPPDLPAAMPGALLACIEFGTLGPIYIEPQDVEWDEAIDVLAGRSDDLASKGPLQ